MKTKLFLSVLIFLASKVSFSQQIPFIKVKDVQLEITSLNVDVQVVGNIATTTYDMLFYNPTSEILEGELVFPLGEGQNVVRLALEINGHLREAVVVEKEQGRVAFEAVVRRGVDPVLLEKVTGNNYRARIYPIPATGYKRVVLAYDQIMKSDNEDQIVYVPLEFTNILDHFIMKVEVSSNTQNASIESCMKDFKFEKSYLKQVATVSKKNYKPNEIIAIKVPQNSEIGSIIRDSDYFYFYHKIAPELRLKTKPTSINLLWDASLSMQKRDLEKELKLLDDYFKHIQNVTVNFLCFTNQLIDKKQFVIRNAEWSVLRNQLETTIYDGGTDYSSINSISDMEADVTLFFTDMINNLSDNLPVFNNQLFIINSLIKSNYAKAKLLVESHSGAFINLKILTQSEAINKLTCEEFKLLEIITDNNETEIYPKAPQSIINDFSFSGKDCRDGQVIKLKFGYENKVSKVVDYVISSDTIENPKLGKLWGQNKIMHLQKEANKNKNSIIDLSKEFNIISDFTSLIVLDDVRDYIKYNIKPPSDLEVAYNDIKKQMELNTIVRNTNTTVINEDVRPIEGSFLLSGVVSDDSGTLPGVSVILKSKSTGTETDFDGKFSLNAKQGDIIQFAFIGMKTLEAVVQNSNMNIRMQAMSENLEEIVVSALGVKREYKSVGFSVQSISKNEISNAGSSNISNILAGKVSGVQVSSSPGLAGVSPNIRIRGTHSVNGNNKPLFIIDGVPMVEGESFGDMLDISPEDIKSISVLKGLSGAVLYGSRAANGVVVIDTKRGNFQQSNNQYNSTIRKHLNKYKGLLKVSNSNSNISYLAAYKNLSTMGAYYDFYLTQRDSFIEHPAYFIDLYDLFKVKGYDKLAMRILSNIVEIDIDNYEQLKVFAYKMEAENNLRLASYIYEKILDLRPEDTQSSRDLALVYAKMNNYKAASILLRNIVSDEIYKNSNRRNFRGVNEIASRELDNIIANSSIELDIIKDKKTKKDEKFDLRVVIDWNHNDTDIDLHVVDPNREECYYSHNTTAIGGKLSQDLTQGFGPEEFTLRNAISGNYYVKVNYYGDRYQKLENPTFLKVTIFKNYGKPNQSQEIKVIRLDSKKDDMIVAKVNC